MRHAAWIIASLAVLGAAPASARSFYVIQSGPDAWTVMDPDGIERSGSQATAWSVRIQRNILDGDPPQPGYMRTLTEYDCEQSRTRWREVFVYSRSGALLVHKVNDSAEEANARDRGDIYAAWRIVCAGGSGDSVVAADSVAKVVISLMAGWDSPVTAASPAPAAVGPATRSAASREVPSQAAPAAKPTPPKAKPKP